VPALPAALLLIHGDERFLIDEAVADWRRHTNSQQLSVEVFDAPARLLDLRRSVSEVPLIDPERSILVRDAPQLSASPRRGSDPPEDLAAIVAERPSTTSMCLVAHTRVAAQNPVLAAVRKHGGTVAYFAAPRGRELRSWLDREIRSRGLRLGPGSTDHLLQVVGSDLGALTRELDKLAALAGGGALSSADVHAAVAGDEPIEMWSVLEQLLGPTPARGPATLDRLLADGRSSQHLLAILAGQVRDLMLAQSHLHLRGNPAGLAAELHIPEWRADRLARQARAVQPAVVAEWLRELHDADRRVKAGEIGDVDALRLIGLRAARQVSATRK
jgi:DNA polymerase III subunit delta